MKLFAQIRKVDEEKRLVFGRAVQETVDKSNEILDYEGSKPHFKKWSEDVSNDSGGKSLGNVRAMHGKVAVGKLTAIDYDDGAKAIDVCAKIVDDGEWKKVMEGVYTGFSVGGSYGSKNVEKMDGKDVTRYVAIPNELSLVDRPCIPTARFFEVQKADGSLAKVEFQEPAADGPTREEMLKTLSLPTDDAVTDEDLSKRYAEHLAKGDDLDGGTIEGTPDQVDELTKLMNDNSLNVGKVIEILKAHAEPDGDECPEGENLEEWTKLSPAERKARKDAAAKDLAEKLADPDYVSDLSLTKLEAALTDVLSKVGARNNAVDKGRIDAIHKASVELGATCEVGKVEPAADLAKTVTGEELQKLVADAVAPLQKQLQEAADKITKLEAQPAPSRIKLRAVAKGEDFVTDDLGKIHEPQPIKDAQGEVHAAASLIKGLHQSGGAPLTKS